MINRHLVINKIKKRADIRIFFVNLHPQNKNTFRIDMNVLELSEQEIGRRQSLEELRSMGIDPYPAAEYPTDAFSTDIIANFSDDAPQREVCIAGRLMSRRVMGKASFAEIQDSKGRVQGTRTGT